MKIMIIGGNGFIGSHLAAHLLSQGHLVTVVDKREPVIPIKPSNALSWIQKNINSDQDAQDILDLYPDMVVYCASAVPDEIQGINSPSMTMRSLSALTSSFYAARAVGVKRFVYLSNTHCSDVTLKPLALMHHLAEAFLQNEAINTQMDIVILKLAQVYAAGTVQIRDNFLNCLVRAAKTATPLIVNPQTRSDFVYINDVIVAISAVLKFGYTEIRTRESILAHKLAGMETPSVYDISSGQLSMSHAEIVSLFNDVATINNFPSVSFKLKDDHTSSDMLYEESDIDALLGMTGDIPLELEQGMYKLIAMEQLLAA